MEQNSLNTTDITEIRRARNEAETLRDRLLSEYDRLSHPEDSEFFQKQVGKTRYGQGCEAMRKAIVAANHAIACINQALSQIERADEN